MEDIRIALDRFPKVSLCHQPTPIELMPRLSAYLGTTIYVKRDDCTGLATGGNKTRKLEFLLGEAVKQNADLLVTQGAVQSNHVRQTAAAACKFGLDCHALLERRVPHTNEHYEVNGNVLLDELFDCSIEFRPSGLDMNAEAVIVAERFKSQGRTPYFIPGGGSNEIGALGYVACALEIVAQANAMDTKFDWLVMGTGSTGTQAGLLAGLDAINSTIPVMGISVRQPQMKQLEAVYALAVKVSGILGKTPIEKNKVIVDDGYVGEGYGIPAQSTVEAIKLAAKYEGILLDPVYSGKGFAGLVGLAKNNTFKATDNILFLHTGGASSLFVYEEALLGNK